MEKLPRGIIKRGLVYYFTVKVDGKYKRIKGTHNLNETIELQENYKNLKNLDCEMYLYDLLDRWNNETSFDLKESTKITRTRIVKKLKKSFKNQKIRDIKKYDLQLEFNKLAKDLKISTLKVHFNYLKQALDYAVNIMEILNKNPCNNIEVKGNKKNDKRVYTEKEIETIIDFFKKRSDKLYYYIFIIGINTGMRKSEIIALKWENVDLEKGIIKVVKGGYYKNNKFYSSTPKTKTSKREIILNDFAINKLKELKESQDAYYLEFKEYIKNNGIVFQNSQGKYLSYSQVEYFSNLIKRIVNISSPWHSMRYTHITNLIERGANIKAVQYRAGHSNIQTTLNIYTKITDNLKESIKKFL